VHPRCAFTLNDMSLSRCPSLVGGESREREVVAEEREVVAEQQRGLGPRWRRLARAGGSRAVVGRWASLVASRPWWGRPGSGPCWTWQHLVGGASHGQALVGGGPCWRRAERTTAVRLLPRQPSPLICLILIKSSFIASLTASRSPEPSLWK
jgi:hypothetical protein